MGFALDVTTLLDSNTSRTTEKGTIIFAQSLNYARSRVKPTSHKESELAPLPCAIFASNHVLFNFRF